MIAKTAAAATFAPEYKDTVNDTRKALLSSALFILVRRVNFDKVLPELKPFGGKLLKTSLTNDQEERLKKALESLNSSGTTA